MLAPIWLNDEREFRIEGHGSATHGRAPSVEMFRTR